MKKVKNFHQINKLLKFAKYNLIKNLTINKDKVIIKKDK